MWVSKPKIWIIYHLMNSIKLLSNWSVHVFIHAVKSIWFITSLSQLGIVFVSCWWVSCCCISSEGIRPSSCSRNSSKLGVHGTAFTWPIKQIAAPMYIEILYIWIQKFISVTLMEHVNPEGWTFGLALLNNDYYIP